MTPDVIIGVLVCNTDLITPWLRYCIEVCFIDTIYHKTLRPFHHINNARYFKFGMRTHCFALCRLGISYTRRSSDMHIFHLRITRGYQAGLICVLIRPLSCIDQSNVNKKITTNALIVLV